MRSRISAGRAPSITTASISTIADAATAVSASFGARASIQAGQLRFGRRPVVAEHAGGIASRRHQTILQHLQRGPIDQLPEPAARTICASAASRSRRRCPSGPFTTPPLQNEAAADEGADVDIEEVREAPRLSETAVPRRKRRWRRCRPLPAGRAGGPGPRRDPCLATRRARLAATSAPSPNPTVGTAWRRRRQSAGAVLRRRHRAAQRRNARRAQRRKPTIASGSG